MIRYNDISNVCRDSHDYGAIEAWGVGRDNLWEGNAVHDVDQAVKWDGWAHALFPDDATNHHTFRKNVVYECKGGKATGGVMLKAVSQVFENNIIADCAIGRGASLTPYVEAARDIVFRRNILFGEFPKLYDVRGQTSSRSMAPGQNTFTAMRELDYNLVYPHHPDLEAYREHGWDAHSVSADPLFDIKRPEYDRHYSDYRLKPGSPALALGFEQIEMEKIGLRDDFPFDRSLIGRKRAEERIQAEDYDRMRGLRAQGSTCIYHIEPGAWAKYENVDFGESGSRRLTARVRLPRGAVTRVRLDRPEGPVVAEIAGAGNDMAEGWVEKSVTAAAARGVHTLFLTFEPQGKPDRHRVDWFRFEGAWSK